MAAGGSKQAAVESTQGSLHNKVRDKVQNWREIRNARHSLLWYSVTCATGSRRRVTGKSGLPKLALLLSVRSQVSLTTFLSFQKMARNAKCQKQNLEAPKHKTSRRQENKPLAPRGAWGRPGQILSNYICIRVCHSAEYERASFHGAYLLGQRPRVQLSGVTLKLAVCSRLFLLTITDSQPQLNPALLYCDDNAGPHRHAGVILLPQQICAVPAIASATLLCPVSM